MVYSFEVDDWKYITRASGAEKMAGNEKTGPEHDGRIIHKHTHTHPIPSHSFIPFRSVPSLHIRHPSHKHTHTHAHSLTRMRSQARQPKRLQGLSCVPTIRASRADTAWQTKLTPRTSGACSSAQLPEHAM